MANTNTKKEKIEKKAREQRARKSRKKIKDGGAVCEPQLSNFPLTGDETYRAKYGARPAPRDVRLQNKLGEEMIAWALQSDALAIEDFPLSKLISPRSFYSIAKYNNYFADCLDIARSLIGSRLYKGALEEKWSAAFILKILPLYNEQLKQLQAEQRAKISDEIAKRSMQVVMETFPNSDKVPEKPKSE